MSARRVPSDGGPSRGKTVRIKTAHKILIGSAIAFFIFFGVWQFRVYTRTGEAGALVIGILSAMAVIGFGIYYRSLRQKEF